MTPSRTTPGGRLELDRRFPGVGRVRLTSGTRSVVQFRKYDALLTKLYEVDRLDLLRALQQRRVTLKELADADRRGQLGSADADVLLSRSLADAIAAVAAQKGNDGGALPRPLAVSPRRRSRGSGISATWTGRHSRGRGGAPRRPGIMFSVQRPDCSRSRWESFTRSPARFVNALCGRPSPRASPI